MSHDFQSPVAEGAPSDEQIKALMPAPNVFERDRDDGWSEDRVIDIVRAALAAWSNVQPKGTPDHVPVSPEHEAKIDAALGLKLLPPIRVDLATFEALEMAAFTSGQIIQAVVRERLSAQSPAPAPEAQHKECATFPPHQRCAECMPAGANDCDLEALLQALQQGESLSTDQRSVIWTRLQAPAVVAEEREGAVSVRRVQGYIEELDDPRRGMYERTPKEKWECLRMFVRSLVELDSRDAGAKK